MTDFICLNCQTIIEGREEGGRTIPPGSCWKCGSAEIVENEQTQSILDVKMKCPECGLVAPVWDCDPDIDGLGSLGCSRCLYVSNKKVVVEEKAKEI